MTSVKNNQNNLKINNSYESEPSSGSGSSLSEHHDYGPISDDENLNLPYLLQPKTYETKTTTIDSDRKVQISHKPNQIICPAKTTTTNSKDERNLIFGIPVNSSQESSFEGFGASPFNKLQRLFYPPTNAKHQKDKDQQNVSQNEDIAMQKTITIVQQQHKASPAELKKPSPGKMIFSTFYDTIIEENSCNAVDMQMSNEQLCEYNRRTINDSQVSENSDVGGNPSSELSFNGKIQSLTKADKDPVTTTIVNIERLPVLMETSLNDSQQHFSESFIKKRYTNEKSPDLFGDDDDDDDDVDDDDDDADIDNANKESNSRVMPGITDTTDNRSFNCPTTDSSFANDDQTFDGSLTQISANTTNSGDSFTLYKENCRREREMLRRIRKCLSGVLPPPSVTIPQLDMFNAVLSKKNAILNYFDSPQKQINQSEQCTGSTGRAINSLFKPSHTLEEAKAMPWRDILGVRQHGLSYNLSKASESNEYLSLTIVERFIGAETASSYRNSPSSAKKRSTRLKLLCQSPGNRLSHLAKRRAIFSSANLATTSQKSNTSIGPQILIDKKKIKNRRKATPKRKTPASKKKVRKTPSSSARKRVFRTDLIKPGPSRETSKRALFQSPAKQQRPSLPKPPVMKPELANRVEKSKRALLFTPEKHKQNGISLTTTNRNSGSFSSSSLNFSINTSNSNSDSNSFEKDSSKLENLLKRKRNRCDDDDNDAAYVEDANTAELTANNSKLFKSDNSGLTPRALKIKSQSFCIGAGSSSNQRKQLPCASLSSSSCTNTSSSGTMSSLQHLQRTSSSCSLLEPTKMTRAYSDMSAPSNSLTDNQKKKLLWAVSQALQERKITGKHESFKQYASILARVVRRIFQEYYQKGSTSNSETMLRLAKKYVYNVTTGSTADDVYLQAKHQIDGSKRQSTSRLSGYIGPEEFQQLKQSQQQQQSSQISSSQSQLFAGNNTFSFSHKGSTHNIFTTEMSQDSFASSGFCSATPNAAAFTMSQSSLLGHISQDIIVTQTSQGSNPQSASKSIQNNPSLQNSSSKSNLCGVVLRENVDCELRRSAQKNFTGKDQRNMSPYACATSGNGGSAVKAHTQLVSTDCSASTGSAITNSAKARRQILFDS